MDSKKSLRVYFFLGCYGVIFSFLLVPCYQLIDEKLRGNYFPFKDYLLISPITVLLLFSLFLAIWSGCNLQELRKKQKMKEERK